MKLDKRVVIDVKLEDSEKETLNNTVDFLKNLFSKMTENHCDSIECCGEYAYHLHDLEYLVNDLEMLVAITALTN